MKFLIISIAKILLIYRNHLVFILDICYASFMYYKVLLVCWWTFTFISIFWWTYIPPEIVFLYVLLDKQPIVTGPHYLNVRQTFVLFKSLQLHSFHMPARFCSKSFKLGFRNTWTKNFQMYKLDLEKIWEPEIRWPAWI